MHYINIEVSSLAHCNSLQRTLAAGTVIHVVDGYVFLYICSNVYNNFLDLNVYAYI